MTAVTARLWEYAQLVRAHGAACRGSRATARSADTVRVALHRRVRSGADAELVRRGAVIHRCVSGSVLSAIQALDPSATGLSRRDVWLGHPDGIRGANQQSAAAHL